MNDPNAAKPFKPDVICCGCGKKERDGNVRFMDCPKCIELKLIGSRFCSQECFANAWPSHRQYHKTTKKIIEFDPVPRPDPDSFADHDDLGGDYEQLIAQGHSHLFQNDIAQAKSSFRKAMKMDSRRPEAYADLSQCYVMCDLMKESIQLQHMALTRWAYVALMGRIGDHRYDDHDMLGTLHWSRCINKLMYDFLTENCDDWGFPSWFFQDAILRRVTKLANEFLQMIPSGALTKSAMFYVRAMCLSGFFIRGGKIIHMCLPKGRTKQDLIEAVSCFRQAQHGENDKKKSKFITSAIQFLSRELKKGKLPEHAEKIPHELVHGSWVMIQGLTSAKGLSMNNKAALVCGQDELSGRFIVKLDNNDSSKKLIQSSNLVDLPYSDDDLALFSTMEESGQWAFVKYREEFR